MNRGGTASVRPRNRTAPPRRILPVAFFLVTAGLFFFALPPAAAPEERSARPAPPGRLLTDEEAQLWEEQRIDAPADHLLSGAAVRAAGGTTDLRIGVILIDFPDFAADRIAHPPAFFETIFFSHGVLPNGSVAEFLERSSRGKLRLSGLVRGWFTAPFVKKTYTDNRGGLGFYPQNSQRLAEEAMYLADDAMNFAGFDNDGPDGIPDSGDDDEVVDGVAIVHAGFGRESGGTTANDFVSVHWWTPQDFPTDGVFGRFFTLTAENSNLGTMVHELGHLLGLPDLYDTSGRSYGLGAWSMMAGGSNLEQGDRPSDFDAYCKAKLGFVSVLPILANTKNVVIPPTIAGGQVLRLWRGGDGNREYFLLENRRREGLDAALPGEGLLIYHVDEGVSSNVDANHYHVALEQADGLFQLEARFNDPSIGDEGDPYNPGDAFGRYTIPSSMDYDGVDTYVHVYNIRGPDPEGALTADISVEPGPLVSLVDVTMVELSGNGNGLVEGGETAGIYPRVAVSRSDAHSMVLRARSLDPRGTLLDTERILGDANAGEIVDLVEPLRLQVAGDLPSDPYGVSLELELEWADAPPRLVPIELGIGTRVGREDDFESADHGWTHGPVRPTAFDQWFYGPGLGAGGTAGFKHGSFNGGYLRGNDAVLTSPPILLPPSAALLFDHAVDIAVPDTTRPEAGGLIEISVNGGDWQLAEPDGGYPKRFGGNHIEWQGRPIFVGTLYNGTFRSMRIPLSAYRGSIRVRFRFFSEVDRDTGGGWRIDNVRVVEETTPVRVLDVASEVVGEDVHLRWMLADPLPFQVRWRRGPELAQAEVVGSGWLPAASEGRVIDPGGRKNLPSDYWLEGMERDGSMSGWGPWRVLAAPPAEGWQAAPNPARSPVLFAWDRSLPEGSMLEVYDLKGRLVRRERLTPAARTVAWDGRNERGAEAAPGIYFARLRGSDFPPLRLVRLP